MRNALLVVLVVLSQLAYAAPPSGEIPFYFPPAWSPQEVQYMRDQLTNAGHRVEMVGNRYAVIVSRDRYPAFFRYTTPDGPVRPSPYPSQYLGQQVNGQGVTTPPIRSQSYGYFTTSADTATNGHANWGYNRPGLRSLNVYGASDLDIPGTFGEIDQETLLGYRRGAFRRGDYSVVVRTPRPGVQSIVDRLIGRPSSPDPLPPFRMLPRDWGRVGGGLEQVGGGAFVALASTEQVIDALLRAPDDPFAILAAGGAGAAAAVGTSAVLFGGANVAGGLGLGGAAGGLSAGGAAVATAVLPAAAVCATAAGGLYVGHQLDGATGGYVSDSAATAACAVADTVANIFYRWWGSEWNYGMTRESANMFGGPRKPGTCP